MPKMTPPLKTKGRYVLREPWGTIPTMLYTCMAIRSFDDIYKLGRDVAATYYTPMGLTEGAVFGVDPPFHFNAEKALEPNIITLIGDDDSVIYVPDTYILSYPDQGEVKYSQVVLSIGLPSIPDYVDLGPLRVSVANLVAETIGVVPVVKENRAASTANPTRTQHEILEVARLAGITNLKTDRAKYLEALNQISTQADIITALKQKLIDLGEFV